MSAGCLACGGPYFRTVRHPVTETLVNLYPAPGTKFLAVTFDGGGVASGLPICADCGRRPTIEIDDLEKKVPGMTGIQGLLTAREKNAWYFTEKYGAFLTAWCRDHLRMDPEPVLRQWRADCAAEGVPVG